MLHFMKYKVGIPLLVITALAAFFSFKYITDEAPGSQSRKILIQNAVVGLIREGHFAPRDINDSFSNVVFNKLIETADFEKKFLTKEDIDAFSKYRFLIDDQIRESKFDAYEMFSGIYRKRLTQVAAFYKEAIKQPFDFSIPDSIQLNAEKIDFAANEQELRLRWDKYVKYRVLAKYMELKKIQSDEKNRRDTAKVKDTSAFVLKSDAELLRSARGKVDTNLNKYFTKLNKSSDEDRFAMYMNAITHAEDPHTDFFPPREKKAFDVQMSGEFFGIGAQLKLEDDKVKIASIVPGSPSWKQGELKANDEILKVGQGAAEPEDVQGYELEDVVQKIRGEKGTEVRLTVKRIDGSIKVIPIIRGKVALEETFAKSALIKTKSGKIGYIYLSEFYSNFTSPDGRRSADDIAKEVDKLKKENVKGIILDLRYNGGGSLYDVVDMSGVFVGAGPVVQVKTSEAQPIILKSRTPGVTYDGPFIIMVNQASASASEILAAAMQDYKRAVIVGNTTFGKGTVQKQIPLEEVMNEATRLKLAVAREPELGSLKLTIQKFYRVTGGSTQLRGVSPDISIPDVYSEIEIGERKDKAALPYDEIAPAQIPTPLIEKGRQLTIDGVQMDHSKWAASLDMNKLRALSAKRIAASKSFENVRANAARLKKLEEDNVVYLDEANFKREQDEATALARKIEDAEKGVTQLDIENVPADMPRLTADTAALERNKNWIRLLKKDITLAETVNIMQDIQSK